MKIYLLRHAQTGPNVSGEMVKDYSKCGILPQEPGYWNCCRKFINQYVTPNTIFCSDTLRAKQTAKMIYPDRYACTENQLNDFDCSKVGPKKFWEMSREEFDEKVHIGEPEIYETLTLLINNLAKLPENSLCITHGLLMKALYQYAKDPLYEISIYNLLTRPKKQIYNLDLMELDVSSEPDYRLFYDSNIKVYSFQDYYTNNFVSTYYD